MLRGLIVVFVLVNLIFAKDLTYGELIEEIEAILPSGWFLEKGSQLKVVKKEKVVAKIIYPSMCIRCGKPIERIYFFILQESIYISPKLYFKLKKENENLQKEGEKLYSSVIKIPHDRLKTPPWKYEYKTRGKEEEQLVNRYKSIYTQIIKLPTFYIKDKSFLLEKRAYVFANQEELRECDKVTKNVLSLLSLYTNNEVKIYNSFSTFQKPKNIGIMIK